MKPETEAELLSLKEFQQRVADLDQDDATCLRFLIAREFNLDRAEDMIRKCIAWRKEVDIKSILDWELPEYICQDLFFRVTGVGKHGQPVFWIPMGIWKARYWIERGKKDETTNYGFHILETALKLSREQGDKPITALFALEELTYHKVSHLDTLRVLYSAFQALEQNYPEIVANLLVINAPWVFTIAFNFIKPILSPRTLGKLQIFGSDKTQWLPVLRELMADECIPKQYLAK